MITEHKHVQFALLNDGKHLYPALCLCALAMTFPVLLPRQHALLGPRGTQQSQLIVSDTNIRRVRLFTVDTSDIIVFFPLPDDRLGEVRSETDWCIRGRGG